MNPETIDKLKEVFTPIAQKIGEGTQFGWEAVLKQQEIIGITWLVVAIICFVAVAIFMWKMTRSDGDGATWGFFFSLVGFVWSLFGGLPLVLNPEFYAIKFFLYLIK